MLLIFLSESLLTRKLVLNSAYCPAPDRDSCARPSDPLSSVTPFPLASRLMRSFFWLSVQPIHQPWGAATLLPSLAVTWPACALAIEHATNTNVATMRYFFMWKASCIKSAERAGPSTPSTLCLTIRFVNEVIGGLTSDTKDARRRSVCADRRSGLSSSAIQLAAS